MTRAAGVFAVLLCVALLVGCDRFGVSFGGGGHDGGRADWVKSGVDPAHTEAEFRDCEALAESATTTDADIDQDIAATRGADMQRDQIVQMRAQQMHEKTRRRGEAVVASCMRQKGFAKRQ
ncbi:MAG TPA: hypothetical protein VND87_07560 [Stellaceae bacterium]|nr:hypothetical protein [Stellaceae bacterium]